MDTKICPRCHEEKLVTEFHKDRSTRDGLQTACKGCKKASRDPHATVLANRRSYLNNREKVNERSAQWREANVERARELSRESKKRTYHLDLEGSRLKKRKHNSAYRARMVSAKETGDSIDPRVLHARDAGICYLCLAEVDLHDSHIDHVVPLVKGGEHTYANTALVHPRCNMRKRDRLVERGAFRKRR